MNQKVNYPPLIIHTDEHGNWIMVIAIDKLRYWLLKYPEWPVCKKYLDLYPNFLKDTE